MLSVQYCYVLILSYLECFNYIKNILNYIVCLYLDVDKYYKIKMNLSYLWYINVVFV